MSRAVAMDLDDVALEAANRLAAENRGLVYSVARKVGADSHLDFEERVSAGLFGLVRAARLFDPTRNLRFSTYAVNCIKMCIRQAVQNERLIRVPPKLQSRKNDAHKFAGYASRARSISSLSDFVSAGESIPALATHDVPADDGIELLACTVRRAIDGLDERKRTILQQTTMGGKSLLCVAKEFGISKQRVVQIRITAIRQVRQALEAEFSPHEIDEMYGRA